MGEREVKDVTLIRHAYVRTSSQKRGIGARLLAHLRGLATGPVLVGTWADASWAIQFYEKCGFERVDPEEKDRLLRKYWTVPERQIETSVVLQTVPTADRRAVGPASSAEGVMKAGGRSRIVLVTCGSAREARKIARSIVQRRLVACANILPAPVESVYRWKGNIETAREYLLIIKTTAQRLTELEREVKRLHSYDVPEFIALPIAAGSRDYLSWLADSVKPVL